MVDPLDGTKEFLKGNGEFTVNIALMCDNEPYIGIIYVPYIRRIYFAQRGVGSYLKTDVRPDGEASFDLTGLWSDSVRLPLRECANEPTAAGEVILSEAGGVVEPFGGGTGMQYNKTSLHNPYFVCRSKFFR